MNKPFSISAMASSGSGSTPPRIVKAEQDMARARLDAAQEVIDGIEPLMALVQTHRFKFLGYLLTMALLEATEIASGNKVELSVQGAKSGE